MATVEVTQYHLPDGRKTIEFADIPDDLFHKYLMVTDVGCNIGAEILNTGHVSLTIEDPVVEDDFAIEVVPNGPEVPVALERMLSNFDPDKHAAFRLARELD